MGEDEWEEEEKGFSFFTTLIVFFPHTPTTLLPAPNMTVLTKARGMYFGAVTPYVVEEHAVVGAA